MFLHAFGEDMSAIIALAAEMLVNPYIFVIISLACNLGKCMLRALWDWAVNARFRLTHCAGSTLGRLHPRVHCRGGVGATRVMLNRCKTSSLLLLYSLEYVYSVELGTPGSKGK